MEQGVRTGRARACLPWLLLTLAVALVFFGAYHALLTWPVEQNMRTADHRVAAVSFLEGKGFQTGRGEPYAKGPPIYPLLLAGLHRLDVEWWASVCLINAGAFALGLIPVFSLGRSLGLRRPWMLLAAYLCCAPLWYLVREARPDVIYAVAAIAITAAAAGYLRTRSLTSLVTLSVLCTVAAFSRYMALFVTVPLAGLVVALAPGQRPAVRVRRVLVFLIIGCMPIGGWLVRTKNETGYWSGMDRHRDRRPLDESLTTFDANVTFLAKTLAIDAFAPVDFAEMNTLVGDQPVEYDTPLKAVLLAFAGAGLLLTVFRARGLATSLKDVLSQDSGVYSASLVLAVHFVWYQAAILLLWTYGNNDPIDTRFVAPSFFLGVLLAAVPVAVFWRASKAPGKFIVGAFVLSFCSAQATKTVANWKVVDENQASPWVEDMDQFIEAMSRTDVEDRVLERLQERGRDEIPERLIDKLEAKGKDLDPDEDKMERVRELADLLDEEWSPPEDDTEGSTGNDAHAVGADPKASARDGNRRDRNRREPRPDDDAADPQKERDKTKDRPVRKTRDASDQAAPSGSAPSAPEPPAMEHIRFTDVPNWPVFQAGNMGPNYRLGYVLGTDAGGRAQAKLTVNHAPGKRGANDDFPSKWSELLIPAGEAETAPTLETSELDVPGLTVKLMEASGDFRAEGKGATVRNHTLIGAVIIHPDATHQVRAFGPAAVMAAQREEILRFIRSVRPLKK